MAETHWAKERRLLAEQAAIIARAGTLPTLLAAANARADAAEVRVIELEAELESLRETKRKPASKPKARDEGDDETDTDSKKKGA